MVVLVDKLDATPVRRLCARHGNRPEALIEILHDVQRRDGSLSDAALREIADALNLSRADVHGVASFYHDFRREPPPRHILKICRAEACQASGGEALAAHAEDRFAVEPGVAVEAVYCLGNCALGPAAMLDDALHGRVTPERLEALVASVLDDGRAEN